MNTPYEMQSCIIFVCAAIMQGMKIVFIRPIDVYE